MAQWALDYDGADDYVDCGSVISLGSGDYALEAWFKCAVSISDSGTIFSRWGDWADNNDWHLFVYNVDGSIIYQARYHTLLTLQDSSNDYRDNTWHYVAVVKTDTGGTGTKLYVDGVLKDSGAGVNLEAENFPFRIGINAALTNDFKGVIDEVRVSSASRSLAEIEAIWNNGNGVQFEVDGNTVALWHMNDGSGGTILDETANNNDGTITGASWVAGYNFIVIYELSCSDGLNMGDTPITQVIFEALATDGLTSGDTPMGSLTLPLSLSDGLVSGDTPTVFLTIPCSVTDGVVLGDTPLTQAILNALAADGIALSDLPAIYTLINLLATDGIKLGDITIYYRKSIKRLGDFTGREMIGYKPDVGYPYTYPFYYDTEVKIRDLSDPEVLRNGK